jgi:PKD repeat protein
MAYFGGSGRRQGRAAMVWKRSMWWSLACVMLLSASGSASEEPLSITISPNLDRAREEGFHLIAGHSPLTVDFSAEAAGGTSTITCSWDFDGDGRIDSMSLDPLPFTYSTPGVYRALVRVRDGTGQEASSTQRIVVISPANLPDWQYGLVAHLNRSYGLYKTAAEGRKAAELIRDLGVDVVRLDLAWSAVQPTANQYLWDDLDDPLDLAVEYGFDLMPILGFSTKWASSAVDPGEWSDWFFAPPRTQEYAWFAYEAAARYAGHIKAWEIWSEPNAGIYWRPTPDPVLYTELLKNAYLAIKYADPSAAVALGGLANDESRYQPEYPWIPPEEFLQAVYDHGGGPYFDVVARHPYTHPNEGVGALSARLRSFRLVMEGNGDTGKPIWLTEIGYAATPDAGVTEARQSEWLVECLGAMQELDYVTTAFWYNLRDTGPDPSDWEQNLGLIAHDWTLEPDYEAYRALIAERE